MRRAGAFDPPPVEAGDMSTSDGLGGDLDRAEGEGRR